MVRITGAEPVIIKADQQQNFKISAQQLASAVTPKTRLFIINSPSNPSGMAYSEQELKALAEVLLQHPQLLIATDDIYEHILWNGHFVSLLNVCPALYERTIVVNGVSKAYAMTGWRIGYAAGPGKLIGAMKKVQSQSTSNPCSISQAAAQQALSGPQDCIKEMLTAFKQRHDFVVQALNQLPGVDCSPGDGTFYSFPNCQELISQLADVNNDVELAEYLLNKAGVALVPGSAFGLPGYLRLSYATGLDTLKQALARIKQAIQ
jgi:aspartate aminotransferase